MKSPLGNRRKKNLRFRRRTSPGAAPGTVVADPHALPTTIRLVAYGLDDYLETALDDLDRVPEFLQRYPVVWIDVQGFADIAAIKRLGELIHLHPLTVEDVVNTHQRAKVEEYDDQLFIVVRTLLGDDDFGSEQFSVCLGQGWVVTFQERPNRLLLPVTDRVRHGSGQIRSLGADYLAYALLDAVVDAYFPMIEHYGEMLDRLDDEISARPRRDTMLRLYVMRSELLLLHRMIWPLREDVWRLVRQPHPLLTDQTRVFLRDCHDHVLQVIDLIEISREMCTSLRDYYLSMLNNRMSSVMQTLTIIATLFMPLSFITGIYGMNFNPRISPWNMPELGWYFGYPLVLGVMLIVTLIQIYLFHRRGWFRRF